MYNRPRPSAPHYNTIPSGPYASYNYVPPLYEHIYGQYHLHMHYIPPPPSGLGMRLNQREKTPPKNDLQPKIKDLQK